jgi:hypothetical protein
MGNVASAMDSCCAADNGGTTPGPLLKTHQQRSPVVGQGGSVASGSGGGRASDEGTSLDATWTSERTMQPQRRASGGGPSTHHVELQAHAAVGTVGLAPGAAVESEWVQAWSEDHDAFYWWARAAAPPSPIAWQRPPRQASVGPGGAGGRVDWSRATHGRVPARDTTYMQRVSYREARSHRHFLTNSGRWHLTI